MMVWPRLSRRVRVHLRMPRFVMGASGALSSAFRVSMVASQFALFSFRLVTTTICSVLRRSHAIALALELRRQELVAFLLDRRGRNIFLLK